MSRRFGFESSTSQKVNDIDGLQPTRSISKNDSIKMTVHQKADGSKNLQYMYIHNYTYIIKYDYILYI